jgi:hypothetical protein
MLVFQGSTYPEAYRASLQSLMNYGIVNNARGTISK